MHLEFAKLLEISAKLRGENGCPWDKKQTLESLAPKVLEEAQELLEAVQKGDLENIEEELGDVLFTLIMLAEIAKDEGKFDIDSAMTKVGEKFISRHTWVFGGDTVTTPEEAVEQWNKNKAAEKAKKSK
ncbi:MAG: MazG nucleotide pyrophosphohydrolase domain-containing protein [Patescibacteria group bacterium]